jgi:hypothetical protein
MPENTLNQILDSLRDSSGRYFPQHRELKAVRVVGHTPKSDHYIHEIVLDFADGNERVNAKVYRPGKCGTRTAEEVAREENRNLQQVQQIAEKHELTGIPRQVDDFGEMGAVVSTKVSGLPLQSIILKAALLPGQTNAASLEAAAARAGEWLQRFHHAGAETPAALNADALMVEMDKLCREAERQGLSGDCTKAIRSHSGEAFAAQKRPLRSAAVLNNFVPLNVLVCDDTIGFCEFANLSRGICLQDAAVFLAAVEVLEKYPFCGRDVTTQVQRGFLDAYGASPQEQQLLAVLKMKVLLQTFAQGRLVKGSGVRKQVMWANVMKRFLQQATQRSLVPAA